LLAILKKTLFEAVKQCIGKEISLAIAFSGGLDSSLLAKILSRDCFRNEFTLQGHAIK
jgi:PP-loop superfamily ATP-utilizing enzyme